MKTKKKVLTSLVSLGLGLGVLTGCGSSDNGNASADGTTTLEVWAMGDEGLRLGDMVDAFEAEHPDIELSVTAIPWDQAYDNLVTANAAQSGPDVIQLGSTWVTAFGHVDGLLDLTEYFDSEEFPNINTDSFFEGALEGSTYDGILYAVPWYVETRVLYYRSDLLAEVGFDEAPQTQEELKEVAARLVELNGEGHFGMDLAIVDSQMLHIFANQNGVPMVDAETRTANFSDPAVIEAMEFYASFFEEGLAAKPGQADMDITQAFGEGIRPMFISGPWMIGILENAIEAGITDEYEWSMAPLPAGSVDNSSFLGGAGLAVTSYSDHVEEALTFINFMADPETQVEWYGMADNLPAVISAWEDPALADSENLAAFREQLDYAKAPAMIVEFQEIEQLVITALEQIVVGGADVTETFNRLNDEAQAILDR